MMDKTIMKKYLSEFVKARRVVLPRQRGTQTYLAKKAGMRTATWSEVETGKSCPSIFIVYKMLLVMDTSLSEFSEFIESKEAKENNFSFETMNLLIADLAPIIETATKIVLGQRMHEIVEGLKNE